jgi:DNA topoisomerase-2
LKNGVAPTDIKINPYYEGFKGTITPMEIKGGIKYLIKGKYKRIDEDTIQILELPIGTWTTDYKQFLEDLIEGDGKKKSKSKSYVKDYVDMSTDRVVDFTVTFKSGILDKLETTMVEYNCTALEKFMKLYTTNTNTNMHMFDADDKLKLYKNAEDIVNDYYVKRYSMYEERKKYLIEVLERELCLLSNKAKYITENLNDTIDLRRKKKDVIVAMLKEKGYDEIDGDSEYRYLRKMPMDSVSEEEVSKLLKEENEKKMELNIIQKMKIENMWLNDLIDLEAGYEKYKKAREALMVSDNDKKKGKKKSKKLKLKKSKGKK